MSLFIRHQSGEKETKTKTEKKKKRDRTDRKRHVRNGFCSRVIQTHTI